MATINDPWPKKSLPDGHPTDGMTLEVDTGDGSWMTILDPRSFEEQRGLLWALAYGSVEDIRHTTASIVQSYDYLLSEEIGLIEAIHRLREMRRVRAQAVALASTSNA